MHTNKAETRNGSQHIQVFVFNSVFSKNILQITFSRLNNDNAYRPPKSCARHLIVKRPYPIRQGFSEKQSSLANTCGYVSLYMKFHGT